MISIGSGVSRAEEKKILLSRHRDVRLSGENPAAMTCSSRTGIIAGAMKDGSVRLWSRAGRLLDAVPADRYFRSLTSLCISPNGRLLAVGPAEGYVKLITPGAKGKSAYLRWNDRITAMSFSPDGRMLMVGSFNGDIKLWNAVTHQMLRWFPGHEMQITSLAIAPSGAMAASASWDRTVRLWSITSGALIRLIQDPQPAPLVVYGPRRESEAILSSRSGRDDTCMCTAFSSDGKFLAGGLRSGIVIIWEVESGRVVRRLPSSKDGIMAVAFSGNDTAIACGTEKGRVKVMAVEGDGASDEIAGHGSSVAFLGFGQKNSLISGSCDGTVIEWLLSLEKSQE